jgi:hypothetical protein
VLLVGGLLLLLIVPGSARAQVKNAECIALADFAADRVGAFPSDWRVRKAAGEAVYTVHEGDGRRFLAAESRGLGIQAAKQREWDLDAYPVLAWSWRAREFPRGGDERASATNDSVVAVYMLVSYSSIRGPKAVKYVWSENVPVGTELTSNMGLTQVRVLRSGAAEQGTWVEERVNVRDDFERRFGESTAPTPAGIAVLTDSDDTKSFAAGDYADFRACRR